MHVFHIVQCVPIPSYESCALVVVDQENAERFAIQMSSLSRDVCLFCYTPRDGNPTTKKVEQWLCNKCGKTRLKSGGWTNLLNHLGSCVGLNYKEEYQALVPGKSRSITLYILALSEQCGAPGYVLLD